MLWRRAFGALKDQSSVWIATLGRRTALRNPEIEAAIIKATSHDELFMDTKNIAFLYRLLRLSSSHHKPIMFALSKRLEKTQSWVVALKGLILMHGIFACKIPSIQRIGRLPFNLSNFKDGHSSPEKTWAHDTFIQSYYEFLDKKSAFLVYMYNSNSRNDYGDGNSMTQEFVVIQKLQDLLDILLEIRPKTNATIAHPLFVEAIDCAIVEVFDIYSQICSRISKFLLKICSVGKEDAGTALKIIKKATIQGENLSSYFEVCKEIGVMNASDCPRIEKIAQEDMQDLEDIINGVVVEKSHEDHTSKEIVVRDPHQEVALTKDENDYSNKLMMTIVTENWETFEEDWANNQKATKGKNPFEDIVMLPIMPPPQVPKQSEDVPDLISL